MLPKADITASLDPLLTTPGALAFGGELCQKPRNVAA
jgi:hypothetical protein